MELFDYSLWGAPLALFIAVRVVGGTVGRMAVGSEIAALRAGCLG